MTVGFYTAASGVLNMQAAMDITANNVANVQTAGYKPLRASFSDLMYTVRRPRENPDAEIGHGVKIQKTDLMFDAGQLVHTERELDFAIPGEGMFALRKGGGEIVYSKDGAFYPMQEGEIWYLTDAAGAKVLDADGNPVICEYNENVLNTGKLWEDIGVYTFPNPYGLEASGGNYYLANAATGNAVSDPQADKLQGFLEASSSDIAEQMVNVIQYQRAFSLNTKMVQTADEIENIVNNLR